MHPYRWRTSLGYSQGISLAEKSQLITINSSTNSLLFHFVNFYFVATGPSEEFQRWGG